MPGVVAFLSTEWVEALDEAASASETLAARAQGMSLVVQQQVFDLSAMAPADEPTGSTGSPGSTGSTGADDDFTYHVAFEDGRVSVRVGPAPSATIRFRQDLATALAIATGAMSAQRAFMTGKLRVGGDLSVLLTHGEALAELDDVFAAVRDRTELPSVEGSRA